MSKKPYARKAVLDDVLYLRGCLREEDVRELKELGNFSPEQGLGISYFNSTLVYTICNRYDTPVAMVGVSPTTINGLGCPWMLASPGLDKIKKSFVKETKRYLKEFYELYPNLGNVVHKDNYKTITWLINVCGFIIKPSEREDFLMFGGSRSD
jgi:hypothetical protein